MANRPTKHGRIGIIWLHGALVLCSYIYRPQQHSTTAPQHHISHLQNKMKSTIGKNNDVIWVACLCSVWLYEKPRARTRITLWYINLFSYRSHFEMDLLNCLFVGGDQEWAMSSLSINNTTTLRIEYLIQLTAAAASAATQHTHTQLLCHK